MKNVYLSLYNQRLQNLQKHCRKKDFSELATKISSKEKLAFFISDPFHVLYLTGFKASNGQLLITANKIYLLSDFRYKQKAEAISEALGIDILIPQKPLTEELQMIFLKAKINYLFFEEKNITFQKYSFFEKSLKISLKPFSNLIEKYRQHKDPLEISLIEKAQDITDKTFQTVKKNLKIGMSELDIAWEIEKIGREQGADDISFAPIVAFNEHSAIPHHELTAKKLKRGDIILIDMGIKYQDYCSDMTRMIFTKNPTSEQEKVYQVVLKAQLEAEKKVRAGSECKSIDLTARNIIDKAGYQGKFGHSLGHGIGLEVHESPNLSPYYQGKLEKNNIVTIEPGIYLENNFGVRIEDMVLVQSKGSRNLSKTPKKIEDCLLKI